MMRKHTIKFSKMHGLGNDFMVVDCIRQPVDIISQYLLQTDVIQQLSHRQMGIGFDQLLLVEAPSSSSSGVFRYRIFNADGSEVEQCGNGARCFVKFVYEEGLVKDRDREGERDIAIVVQTKRGLIYPRLESKTGLVVVDMGLPRFQPQEIPFIPSTNIDVNADSIFYPIELSDGSTVSVSVVSMGNPHAVLVLSNDISHSDEDKIVATQGPLIERHESFPQRVNAGFMRVIDRHGIRLRVYERGAGETLACGTGACAAVVAGIRLGLLDTPVTVRTRGGELTIDWQGQVTSSVIMTGPAKTVFKGEIVLPL